MRATVRRSPIRLARPYSPIPLAVFILLVWWVVAHSSGSGWVQGLGDAVFGLLLIGLLGPALELSRVHLSLADAPGDGVAGMPTVMKLSCSERVRITPIDPPGPDCFLGRARHGTDSEVALIPAMRGVHEEVVLEVATAAPFGLQWWTRRVAVRLPRALHVAPRLGHPIRFPDWIDERSGAGGQVRSAEAGDARGVREYRPGDRRARVHWVASAHAGRLMVREVEEPSIRPVTLRVKLPADADAAERTTEQAFGTIVTLLDRALPVVLATEERHGSVEAPVVNRRQAGRRLARAVGRSGTSSIEVLP